MLFYVFTKIGKGFINIVNYVFGMDSRLLAGGLGMIVLLASLVIGAAIVDMTNKVALNVTAGSSAVTSATTSSVQTTFTTFTGFLPIAAMALVGGISLFYLVNLVRGGGIMS